MTWENGALIMGIVCAYAALTGGIRHLCRRWLKRSKRYDDQ